MLFEAGHCSTAAASNTIASVILNKLNSFSRETGNIAMCSSSASAGARDERDGGSNHSGKQYGCLYNHHLFQTMTKK